MAIRRRDFLAGTLAGAGALLAGRQPLAWAETFPTTYDPFELVSLGSTGIKMTRVGMGTGVRGGNRQCNLTRMGQENASKVIMECFDQGVRWFDMADLYGTHPVVSNALKAIPRKELVMVSKIWVGRGGIPEPERPSADIVVTRFLKELNTDYLDLVLIHCQTSPDWVNQQADQMKIMDDLKRKGLIRAVGVSCHSLAALKAAAREPWVDSVHTRINPYGALMDDSPAKVVPVLKEFRANGKGVVGMKIIGEGRFGKEPDKINRSIDFAMNLGCVSVVTVGFDKLAQCKDFADRVRQTPKRAWTEAIPDVEKS
jgi:aryl-alcohol dehydrogenase-like predicted oxidoreductase